MLTRRELLACCAGLATPALLAGCRRTGAVRGVRGSTSGRADDAPGAALAPTLALSLAAYQARLSAASQGQRPFPTELAELGGLTHVSGFLVETPDDIVLLGGSMPDWPALRLDDLLVALRNAYQAGDAYGGEPGCTIDPMREREDPWQLQRVQVFGMPGGAEGAPMAARHVAIDYELKKVSASLASFGSAVTGVYEAIRQDATPCTPKGSVPTRTTHRFWFAPKYPRTGSRFIRDEAGVLIDQPIDVQLLTEEEFFRGTERMGAAPAHPAAARFAESITTLLAGDARKDYLALRGDFRLIELARVLRFANVVPDSLSFLLDECRMNRVSVPSYVGGIRRDEWGEAVCGSEVVEVIVDGRRGLTIREQVHRLRHEYRGGVEAGVTVDEADFAVNVTSLARLRGRVRASRPSADALRWEVPSEAKTRSALAGHLLELRPAKDV